MLFFNKNAKLLKEAQSEIEKLKEHNIQLIKKHEKEIEEAQFERELFKEENTELTKKYGAFLEKDKILKEKDNKIEKLQQQFVNLNQKYQSSLKLHDDLQKEILLYNNTLEIGSFGLYQPQFNFETSAKFKIAIELNYEKQKQIIKSDQAVICTTEWFVEGSKVEGRKMINQYKKLMLFAFNGECEGLISKVKWNNAVKTKDRILKAFEAINKLGQSHRIHITTPFLDCKLEELGLTYEYEQKKNEEKEEQRRIREQMREEEKAQRELERAQKEAEEEEKRYQKALDRTKQQLSSASFAEMEFLSEQVRSLEQKLQEAHERKERAISLAQLTKVGHIYVISNLGSFGEDVYKIGMTRRLDPLDRVKELGDASVPFQFDVHAIIYSENAPELEYQLHKKFSDRRLNRINSRKEFFRVTLGEIEDFVKQHANAEIEFTNLAEAREYRETMTLLEQLYKVTDTPQEEINFPKSLL